MWVMANACKPFIMMLKNDRQTMTGAPFDQIINPLTVNNTYSKTVPILHSHQSSHFFPFASDAMMTHNDVQPNLPLTASMFPFDLWSLLDSIIVYMLPFNIPFSIFYLVDSTQWSWHVYTLQAYCLSNSSSYGLIRSQIVHYATFPHLHYLGALLLPQLLSVVTLDGEFQTRQYSWSGSRGNDSYIRMMPFCGQI